MPTLSNDQYNKQMCPQYEICKSEIFAKPQAMERALSGEVKCLVKGSAFAWTNSVLLSSLSYI